MPKANTPEDAGRLVGEAMTSADVEAALSLYEPDATFALPTIFGEGSVTGLDALREAFGGLLASARSSRSPLRRHSSLAIRRWLSVIGR